MRSTRRPSVRRRRPIRGPALPAVPMRPAVAPAGALPTGGALGAVPLGAGGPPMPAMKKGGRVKKTGPHLLHKGEKVVPAKSRGRAKSIGAAMQRGDFPERGSKGKRKR